MKIYCDLSSNKSSPTAKVLKECRDCGVIAGIRPSPASAVSAYDRILARVAVFRHARTLHIQALEEGYWLVCCPVERGSIVVLDREAYQLFAAFSTPASLNWLDDGVTDGDEAEMAVAVFYKLGLLVADDLPVEMQGQQNEQTLVAWLHITNACNLRCTYCYIQKSHDHMSSETAYRAVDAILRSAVQHNMRQVQLKYAGGEASLLMEQVIALHDYALQQARRYDILLEASILSNGAFLAQQAINELKERGIGVMISLDGIGSFHDRQRPFVSGKGSFHAVDRTIQKLLGSGLVPTISVTVSQQSLAGLPQLVAYILEHDLPFSLNYYRENAHSARRTDLQFAEEEMIRAMQAIFQLIEHKLPRYSLLNSLLDKADMQQMHQKTCGVGQNYLVIDQHGGIARCQADLQRTVTDIRDADPLQTLRDDRSGVQGLGVDEKEGCRECEWRYWCTGGCPLLTYRATGRYDIKSPNCAIYKALFPDVLRLEGLRLLNYHAPLSWENAEYAYR